MEIYQLIYYNVVSKYCNHGGAGTGVGIHHSPHSVNKPNQLFDSGVFFILSKNDLYNCVDVGQTEALSEPKICIRTSSVSNDNRNDNKIPSRK